MKIRYELTPTHDSHNSREFIRDVEIVVDDDEARFTFPGGAEKDRVVHLRLEELRKIFGGDCG
jgi:hypothetical protein